MDEYVLYKTLDITYYKNSIKTDLLTNLINENFIKCKELINDTNIITDLV